MEYWDCSLLLAVGAAENRLLFQAQIGAVT
jgi:hypothetical protein